MGATTFQTIGIGRDVNEAFREARERALYEHGHAGYTGTIAEKPGAVVFTLPPRVSATKFVEWIASEYAQASLSELVQDAERTLRWAQEIKRGTDGRAERIKEAKRSLARVEREYAAFWKKIPVQAHDDVRRAAQIYDQKWDEAVAIELKPSDRRLLAREIDYLGGVKRGRKVFLFCGWASC